MTVPKVTIYVPDSLAERLADHEINVSAAAQDGIARALDEQVVRTVVHRLLREEITLADGLDTIQQLGLSPRPDDLEEAQRQQFAYDFHREEGEKRMALAREADQKLQAAVDRLARPAIKEVAS